MTSPMRDRYGWLRESMASMIGLAITVVVLWMMVRTFLSSSELSDRRDTLQLGLSLLGVILGYYFGRIPAEKRAETADARANEAQRIVAERDQALAECADSSTSLEALLNESGAERARLEADLLHCSETTGMLQAQLDGDRSQAE